MNSACCIIRGASLLVYPLLGSDAVQLHGKIVLVLGRLKTSVQVFRGVAGYDDATKSINVQSKSSILTAAIKGDAPQLGPCTIKLRNKNLKVGLPSQMNAIQRIYLNGIHRVIAQASGLHCPAFPLSLQGALKKRSEWCPEVGCQVKRCYSSGQVGTTPQRKFGG